MEARQELDGAYGRSGGMAVRDQLLEDLPVTERRLDLAEVSTSLLEGGEGPPIVLLHGQGGFAQMWARVIPHLVGHHRVVAPDLPGLGRSEVLAGTLDAPRVVAWLGDLIAQTCAEPPTLIGHSLGGTFAAHFAIEHGDRVRRIVLVDSGSLGRFRPALPVLLALLRFSARPSPATHDRFLRQVFVDAERARAGWGDRWAAFEEYHIDRAAQPSVGAANRQLLRRMGVRRVPPDQLRKIGVPVALIWGRNDPVMRFRIAEEASARLGWPLYPIDDCGHVPHVERPDAFLEALHAAISAM
jgi:pimeloyl-ACP methyl ester carboxylesterase